MTIQITGYKNKGLMHCWDIEKGDRDKVESELKSDGWTIVSISEAERN